MQGSEDRRKVLRVRVRRKVAGGEEMRLRWFEPMEDFRQNEKAFRWLNTESLSLTNLQIDQRIQSIDSMHLGGRQGLISAVEYEVA